MSVQNCSALLAGCINMQNNFRNWYHNLNLRNKLLLTNLIATGFAVLLAVLSMSAFLYFSTQNGMVNQARNLSKIMAENISPAIYFDDRKTMDEILRGMREVPFISSATLYDAQGTKLSTFQRNPPALPHEIEGKADSLAALRIENSFHDFILDHTHSIFSGTPDHARLGTLVLRINLSDMYQQLAFQLTLLIMVGIAGFALTSRMLLYFQKDISEPIIQLTKLMHHVSMQGDLTAHSDIQRTDEIGKLALGFNHMIFEILKINNDLNDSKVHFYALTQRLNALIEAIPDAIFLKDGEGRWLVANESAKQLFQLHDIPWQGKTEMELADLHPGFRAMHEKCVEDDEKAWDARQLIMFEENITAADGSVRNYDVRKVPVFSKEGQREGLVIIGREITQRKKDEADIHRLAYYDMLTQLPNRRLLLDRLMQALAASQRSQHYGALLFLDLDNFKALNDTRGHDVGDLLLIEIAQRLNAIVREGDTVGRLGGDEFVLMLENLSADAREAAIHASMVSVKAREAIARPYLLKGIEFTCTTSIGVSLFFAHHESVDDLLRHADLAMYQAKKDGRNSLRFFDPAMQAALDKHSALEGDLRHALKRQQLRLYYQIQVNSEGHAIGAEALLRWEHPERNLVSPADFIPLAEETGLIVPIGLWVLQTACTQIKNWSGNPATRDLQLAVNVSARQFRQADFVEQVQQVLSTSGINPARLKIELTESLVLDDVSDTITKMRALKALGISFSMDDFGTGYSSLSYLKLLPLDQLKIDQSFVRDLATDANDAAIVQAIITMGRTFGLNVIAEGVETKAQQAFLELHGCHAFQGYLFGKPVPLGQFEEIVSHYA